MPKGRPDADAPFEGETLALIFEKSSTRTRFSFEQAMRQLGGSVITATAGTMQLGRGETIDDTAKVLSRYVDGIMLRANSHASVVELARNATVPVINGLTDYTGGYAVNGQTISAAQNAGAKIDLIADPLEACGGTDVVVADTFVSMGDTDAEVRLSDLMPYQVTDALMERAAQDALFLHCLPAHRDEEVAASVIDGPQSVVFDEAENRLHAQKAAICWCFDA